MKRYVYNGPIMLFDRCVASDWKAETLAQSESKARSNFMYQAKKTIGKAAGAKVTLPGVITAAN